MQESLLLKNIYDVNLSYLLLASSLINHDKVTAMFRLGISDEVAEQLGMLTLTQMQHLAQINQLLCTFRFNDARSINHLTRDSRVDGLQQAHAGILLSTDLLDGISNSHFRNKNSLNGG
ncbi:flagellar transcriptional regulator FlhD [Enterobacter bugandensis]|uniref:flagellar transcriptional regulator FlhD n=1 Tax=Enterobacter bugandensis TaxID=881260 RepID=UPI002A8145AB|nr:flagellar transcriptional regulator FlhD [Enterobacter bugandensis]